jgi:hypothetical protein
MFDKLRELLEKARNSFDFEKNLNSDESESNDTYKRDSQIFDEKQRKTEEELARRKESERRKQSAFQSDD